MCSKWLLTKIGGQGHFYQEVESKENKTKKSRDTVLSCYWSPQRENNGSSIVVSRTFQPGLWLSWTSWAGENGMFHFFCVFSGISTLSFSVLKRGIHAVANHRSVNVRGMVLRLWYSITVFHPDFPSNHGNDHLGNCFSQLPGLLFAGWPRLILSENPVSTAFLTAWVFLKVALLKREIQ